MPHIIKCQRPPWHDTKQYIILQHRPSNYQIRHKWLKFLRELAHNDNTPKHFIAFDSWSHSGIQLRSKRESYISTHLSGICHWHEKHYWTLMPTAIDPFHDALHQVTDWKPTNDATPVQIYRILTKDSTPVFFVNQAQNQPFTLSATQSVPPPLTTFEQYLRTLPKLDYYLLKHTSFSTCANGVMRKIHTLSAQNDIFYEVSDGSMNNKSLSFGWVLGTKRGQKLAWGNGPGYGTATSHRAEGWGKLPAVKFLQHLSKFTSTPFPPTMRLVSFSDNKGLITTLQKRSQYSIPYPNITLKPDWDLTEEIFCVYLSTGITEFSFSWVEGHQDQKAPQHNLPPEARFNVFADQLAEKYMSSNSRQLCISPNTDASKCTLIINNASLICLRTTSRRLADES